MMATRIASGRPGSGHKLPIEDPVSLDPGVEIEYIGGDTTATPGRLGIGNQPSRFGQSVGEAGCVKARQDDPDLPCPPFLPAHDGSRVPDAVIDDDRHSAAEKLRQL